MTVDEQQMGERVKRYEWSRKGLLCLSVDGVPYPIPGHFHLVKASDHDAVVAALIEQRDQMRKALSLVAVARSLDEAQLHAREATKVSQVPQAERQIADIVAGLREASRALRHDSTVDTNACANAVDRAIVALALGNT